MQSSMGEGNSSIFMHISIHRGKDPTFSKYTAQSSGSNSKSLEDLGLVPLSYLLVTYLEQGCYRNLRVLIQYLQKLKVQTSSMLLLILSTIIHDNILFICYAPKVKMQKCDTNDIYRMPQCCSVIGTFYRFEFKAEYNLQA